jgi:hypothetical protein
VNIESLKFSWPNSCFVATYKSIVSMALLQIPKNFQFKTMFHVSLSLQYEISLSSSSPLVIILFDEISLFFCLIQLIARICPSRLLRKKWTIMKKQKNFKMLGSFAYHGQLWFFFKKIIRLFFWSNFLAMLRTHC